MDRGSQKIDGPLTPRELQIAKEAAKVALEQITDNFYKQIGKTVIQRVLLFIATFILGFGWAKGWINFTPPH